MADRILLKGGHVITVDPKLGDIAGGDVLIEDGTIAQVGKDISADADVIDAAGNIVIPGFIDSHRHTWETAIRNCAPNAMRMSLSGRRASTSSRSEAVITMQSA